MCVYMYIRALDSFFPLVALVRLTFSVGRTSTSFGHKYIYIYFFLIQHLINQCMLMNFYHSFSYMVTKVFNIQPFFISIICDLYFVTGIPLFSFTFMILVSRFTRKDNCLFCLYLYTFHFLRLKQKMDSLLFLIKKHNNNKTVGYNDN